MRDAPSVTMSAVQVVLFDLVVARRLVCSGRPISVGDVTLGTTAPGPGHDSPTPALYRRPARPTAAACGAPPPGTQAFRPYPQARSDRRPHRAPRRQLPQLARSDTVVTYGT